jgi:hypothetical protein
VHRLPLLLVLLSIVSSSSALAQEKIAHAYLGPPSGHKGAQLRELFEHPDQWPRTRAQTGGILYADHAFSDFSDAELRVWFGQLAQWELKLELEVGGVKEWGVTGAGTFAGEKAAWERIERLGGRIASIAMDEPLCCVRFAMHKPDDYAVTETAKFIAVVRQAYPKMLIGDIEPYPSLSVEEHQRWIDALEQKLAATGVRGLDFYRIDPDWASFDLAGKGSWAGIRQIEHFCRTRKIPFSLIYWASEEPHLQRRGLAGSSTWFTGVMHEGEAYALAGGAPDQYVIESWIDAPSYALPETDHSTFTGAAMDFLAKFAIPKSSPTP